MSGPLCELCREPCRRATELAAAQEALALLSTQVPPPYSAGSEYFDLFQSSLQTRQKELETEMQASGCLNLDSK